MSPKGERYISIFNLIRTNCLIKVLQSFLVFLSVQRVETTQGTKPTPALFRSGNDTIHIGGWLERNGWKSLLPWVVWVESSKGEHFHDPTHTTDTSTYHSSYRGPGWRHLWKEGVAPQAQHFTRCTFCLTSDPAATRSGYNSPGKDLSNCKSLLLLQDTGYPWMTQSDCTHCTARRADCGDLPRERGAGGGLGAWKEKLEWFPTCYSLSGFVQQPWMLHARRDVDLGCGEVSPGLPPSSAAPNTSNQCPLQGPVTADFHHNCRTADFTQQIRPLSERSLHKFIILCHFPWNLMHPLVYDLIPIYRSFLTRAYKDIWLTAVSRKFLSFFISISDNFKILIYGSQPKKHNFML